MQPTPLCGPQIGAILKAEFVPIAFPIYTAVRLMGNPFGRTPQRG